MSTKIAVCSIGKNPISLIQNLIEYDDTIDLSLITMNILDYKPPEIENVATQWQRYELRNVLKQLGIIENISIPESLIDLLKQNDTLDLDDEEVVETDVVEPFVDVDVTVLVFVPVDISILLSPSDVPSLTK